MPSSWTKSNGKRYVTVFLFISHLVLFCSVIYNYWLCTGKSQVKIFKWTHLKYSRTTSQLIPCMKSRFPPNISTNSLHKILVLQPLFPALLSIITTPSSAFPKHTGRPLTAHRKISQTNPKSKNFIHRINTINSLVWSDRLRDKKKHMNEHSSVQEEPSSPWCFILSCIFCWCSKWEGGGFVASKERIFWVSILLQSNGPVRPPLLSKYLP